ncbi:MAG TPA: CBS domain-containing protein [Bacillota bacterium]|nr:CBS domain-containing protein [Bacillota bacterium]
MLKVNEVMTTHIATIGAEKSVLDAAKVMQAHNVGSTPVCTSNGKVIGILTDRDIVVRAIANNADANSIPVEDIMTREVITASPNMEIDKAIRLMAQNKIRRLPVVNNDTLVGMIAIGDLATRHILHDEAGEALSEISEPSRPMNMIQ